MEMKLYTSEREELCKLQRNLCGSSGYARVICLLMQDKGSNSQFRLPNSQSISF